MATLHLDTLIATHQPVYVRNNRQGIIALTAHDATGNPSKIAIPNTKHPYCLTARVTPYAIQHSTALREAIQNGHLTLLDPEEAEEALKKPGVVQAIQDAENRIGYKSPEVAKHRDYRSNSMEKALADPRAVDPHAEIPFGGSDDELTAGAEGTGDVTNRVVIICALVAESEMDIKDAKTQLQQLQEDLKDEDFEYITMNVPPGTLREWAKERLAERRALES